MDVLIKTIAGILITVILSQAIPQDRKDISLILSVAAVAMTCIVAMVYLKPVIEYLLSLQVISSLDTEMFEILLTAVGVGVVTEITALICKDFGNTTLGRTIQLLAVAVTLWLSLPIFEKLQNILNSVLDTL